jgi:hypothetical protein
MSYAKKIEKLFAQSNVTVNNKVNDRIISNALKALDVSDKTKLILMLAEPNKWKEILRYRIGYLAAMFLIIAFAGTSFVLSKKVSGLKEELKQARSDIAAVPTEDSATINFYLKEHEDMLAQYASHNDSPIPTVQMHIDRDDILYYEMFDNPPDYIYPGIIVRSPPSQGQINTNQTPVISNGHTLSLSEARESADFDLSAPPRLFPGYSLDQIRRIENRDAMQLLYTNGINSMSLFEQPLDGQRSLEPQDFREYAVFQNKGKAGGTILAWRDDALSYVLIGKIEMSQLMDMAQSISAEK